MNLLALEFSSLQRSVAVISTSWEAHRVIGCWQAASRQAGVQASDALALVESALGEARIEREQVEIVVVGIGPGSYTGIRSAIALAQGWELARGVRLLGVSSVASIAAQAQAEGVRGRVEVVIDAQRKEFYLAGYELETSDFREVEPVRLVQAAEVQGCLLAGRILAGPQANPGWAGSRLIFPNAAMLGRLAAGRSDFVPGEKLEPIYLRETKFVMAPPPRFAAP
jgi:tRNA threonylcarbamoyladenosine biosynthesis protein TsaB